MYILHDNSANINIVYVNSYCVIDRGPPVTPTPPWGFFTVVIFAASEYGPIKIRLFAFKLLGLNMLKYAN